ncbi:leucine-rich repeat-containing protein 45-like [Apostichopus japonicus]|uniref:leucine-rich repeat-containing protein 45-like n=1 Tax=Stichopus japonicus TaxID=307972 RepID=UPI003AB4B855
MAGDFRTNFLQICKDNHIQPQESILSYLDGSLGDINKHGSMKTSKLSSTLDLSTCSLSPETCEVLGRVLASDHYYSELKLSDCMIGDEGVKLLVQGLLTNVAIRNLDLKGNNLRGSGTEEVGKLLRHNHTLKRICLEWNSLGLDSSSFVSLAEGIAANTSLQELDLRSNQIHQDSASVLAKALCRNSTLDTIDLRWNTVGLVGGRALSSCFQHNKTLVKLQLAGNNIPQDVLNAVDASCRSNSDSLNMSSKHQTREQLLSREMRHVKKERKREVTDLMKRIDQQGDQLGRNEKNFLQKISRLQEALEERKTAFNALSAQLKSREAELVLTQQQVTEYKEITNRMKEEQTALNKRANDEIQIVREEKGVMESRLVREIAELKDKNFTLEGRSVEVEQKNSHLQEQVYDLKEELTTTQAEMKVQATQAQEKLQKGQHRHQDIQKELSLQHATELSRLQTANDDTEKSYKERIRRLEDHRKEVEEELRKVKSQQLAERLNFEEQLMHTKQKVKEEEQQRSRQLEDRLRMVQLSKDELQQQYSQQSHQISELQARLTNSSVEVEALKRKLDELTQELAGKNNETEAVIGRLEQQYKRQVGRLEGQVLEMEQVKDKYLRIQQEITEQSRKHQTELSRKEGEILSLQDQIRRLEFDMVQARDDETQRASALQAAISSYVQGTPRSPMVTPRR